MDGDVGGENDDAEDWLLELLKYNREAPIESIYKNIQSSWFIYLVHGVASLGQATVSVPAGPAKVETGSIGMFISYLQHKIYMQMFFTHKPFILLHPCCRQLLPPRQSAATVGSKCSTRTRWPCQGPNRVLKRLREIPIWGTTSPKNQECWLVKS